MRVISSDGPNKAILGTLFMYSKPSEMGTVWTLVKCLQ